MLNILRSFYLLNTSDYCVGYFAIIIILSIYAGRGRSNKIIYALQTVIFILSIVKSIWARIVHAIVVIDGARPRTSPCHLILKEVLRRRK